MNKMQSCAITDVMSVIGGKWRVSIIWHIGQGGPIRFNTLKRTITGITTIMLTRSLDDLVAHDIVIRKDYQENPPRVEYSLSKDGETLYPIIEALNDWSEDCCSRPKERVD